MASINGGVAADETSHSDDQAQSVAKTTQTNIATDDAASCEDIHAHLMGGVLPASAADRAAKKESPCFVSRKRKSPGHDADLRDALEPEESAKKVKLAGRHGNQPSYPSMRGEYSLLPAEIWHQIFTFCPPKSLGRLLRVNKLFNSYLDPPPLAHREVHVSVTPSALDFLKPNAIWQASRRLFWPQMPTPLPFNTELDMWRLACSPKCQCCNRQDNKDRSISAQPPCSGPGVNGVAAIWPFAIRVCASCLLQKTIKVIPLAPRNQPRI